MNISIKAIRFDKYNMWVALNDARTIGIPLRSFPKLMQADHEQLSKFEISYIG